MAKKKEIREETRPPEETGLVMMVKDGHEPINVHPTQVGPWRVQGWAIKE